MYIPLGRVRSEVDKGRSINGEAKFELSVSNFKILETWYQMWTKIRLSHNYNY